MGGPIAFRTAAASDRVGAVGSFHGANLVVANDPNSPHTMAAKTKAQYLVAIAQSDDAPKPNDKTILKDTFAAAKINAEVEVYPAQHGWCAIDSNVYNMDQAEKAWTKLLDMYKKAL
jgi:carboxymethylenebutenolidase